MPESGANSLDAFWMPFTPNRRFKANPRMIASAQDMYYIAPDGRKVLDGTAGLWCVNAGHNRLRITQAIQRQAAELDYVSSFNMGHPLAFTFASRLAAMTPTGLDRIFFTNSGSESVDTALKMALAYQRSRGKGGKTRLIGRERGYHGVGFGGISVGGIVRNRMYFGTLLAGVDHLPHTHGVPGNLFSKGQPGAGADLADNLERIVALHDASTIAAVIVEPVAGSTGVLIPPVGYLQRLRALCDKHDILLIFDEVITAFGRLGTLLLHRGRWGDRVLIAEDYVVRGARGTVANPCYGFLWWTNDGATCHNATFPAPVVRQRRWLPPQRMCRPPVPPPPSASMSGGPARTLPPSRPVPARM
jgi:beta-alanine--pyruvate transaminase